MPSPYSYSSLSLFSSCAHAYAHRYVWKTPVPDDAEVDLAMTCGSVVHSVLEWAHTQALEQKPVSWEHLTTALPETWSKALAGEDVSKDALSEYMQKSLDTTKWYFDTLFPTEKQATISVEKKFLYPLNIPRKQWLIGYVDRVSQPSEDKIVLHDYKTGSQKMGVKALSKDFQAMLYGAMAAHTYQPLSEIELQWHYLSHQKTVKVKVNPDNVRDAVQKAQSLANSVEAHKQMELFPAKVGWQCGRCNYQSVCTAYKK
ncbi:MAG: PD-(D/E)XK nuclease family protein [archaeon]